MSNCTFKTRFCYILTFTADQVALALGQVGRDAALRRWPSRFCRSERGGCTLGASDAEALVMAIERLTRRCLAARRAGVERAIVASLEPLFQAIFDPIERCLDWEEKHCVCSWERRIGDSEELVKFLIDVARVYWSTGAEAEWMAREMEDLASRASDVCHRLGERDGFFGRYADDDPCAAARMDRLSMTLFNAVEDLRCGNWGNEDWM
jgi:hypothetical protein